MATVRLQLRRGLADDWFDANPTLAAGEIGIETDTNTFKFGDGNTPWNSLEYALSGTVDDYILLSTKGAANGVASLDSSGLIPTSQLPPLAKVTVSAVANQAARLALTAEAGDIAIQADNGQSYVLASSPASTDGNWRSLVGSEAVVDTVEAALVAGTGLDKTYNDAAGTITIDIDSTVATKTYADQAEADAISTAAADATSKVAAEAALRVSGDAASVSTAAADATTKAATAKSEAITAAGLAADTKVSNAVSALTKSSVGLADVDNTSDANKPVSIATLAALGLKAPLESPALTGTATANNLTISGNLTVNGTTSTINSTTLTVQDKDIVLGQTSSPTDAGANGGGIVLKGTTDKSIKYDVAKSAWELSENLNIPGDKAVKINNVEVLTISTVLGKSLPEIVVGTTETQTLSGKTLTAPTINDPVISGTIVLPITTSIGNVSQDELQSLNGVTSAIQDQISLKAPLADPTFTGTVSGVTKAHVGLGNADNTSDAAKPVSTATQAALDLKAPLENPTFTGTVGLPSTTSIGLASAEEIATLNGATSNIQGQIDLKAPLASPTFTGTVNGITKSMVGLGNVDNTTDLVKPISTATQTALDLKAPLASPTFTGTVTLPVGTITTGMIADGTIVTADVADLAVTTAKIADSAITEGKIANDAVTTGKIAPDTIVNADINPSAAIAQSKIDGLSTSFGLKANLASPTFTGTVVLPTVTAGGSIVPSTDNVYDLGSPTKMWKDIYVGPGSLYVNGQKVIQDESGAIVISADPDENLGLRTSGSGNIELDPTGTGSVNIKGPLVVEAGANFSSADGNGITFSNGLKSDTLVSRTLNTDLSLSGNGSGKVYLNDNAEVNGNLVVTGNFTVNGTTTSVNTETISLADNIIDLNSNFTTGTPTENSGVRVMRGDSNAVQIRWNESSDKWEFTNDGTTYSVVAPTDSPTFTGTVTIPAGASISGFAPLASPTFTGTVTVAASGVAFTDGTQTKQGVPSLTTIGTEISADYNLSTGGLALRDQLIPVAGTRAITVPTNATTAYPIGTSISFYQASGTGANFVAADVTVTILRTPGLKLRTTHSSATLTKVAINTWLLAGDLTA